MEEVLALSAESDDSKRPKVCFDETNRQLLAERKTPLPARAGKPRRFDYEYQGEGTPNLFLCCEWQTGWRHVEVTEQRTKLDFAHQMKWLVDERYPEAEVTRVVLDNLKTHGPGSLYEAFAPEEARRPVGKLKFHYTAQAW